MTAIDGTTTTFNYSAGKVSTIVTGNSRTTTLAYSGSNLTQVTNPDGGVETFSYDANHRMTGQTFANLQNSWAYGAACPGHDDLGPDLRGIPGATEFAGSGPGRTGSNALISNWYGGLGPRLSLAYAINSKTVIRASATRSFGPLAGIGQSSHQLGFAIRNTVNNQSGGVAPLYVLSKGPGVDLTLPNVNPGVGVGGNAPSYGRNGNDANRSDSELNYSFNIQRQITKTSSIEVGWMATLASHITSNFLADNQVPYRSLPASMNPFTTAGRTVLSSQVTSATAIAAGAVVPWTCGANSSPQCRTFTQVWGTGATVTQANRPYPSIWDDRYRERRWRPDRPFHLPRRNSQVQQAAG